MWRKNVELAYVGSQLNVIDCDAPIYIVIPYNLISGGEWKMCMPYTVIPLRDVSYRP